MNTLRHVYFRAVSTSRIVSLCNTRHSSYNSSLSLKNLYPSSSLLITTPSKVPESSGGNYSGYIPIDQLQITYSRSSGPGGQNVNVVNSKVDLRFHVESASWISSDIKAKLLEKYKTKITKDGFFVIRSEKTRSQQLNLADAMERLRSTIWKLLEPEPSITPETEEMLRRRKEKAVRMRLVEKRMKSQKKEDRKAPVVDI
ncbi:large ribosomal subunit protein mL62 [Anabrus simplex]|uniref:large ribosomal subunit protein mL62 n=1 Tax=Anabrus simplex TaxID=316456 RepID=UPI0035A3207D